MSDAEYHDTMESLQIAGHPVRWFVHALDRFNRSRPFHSRALARSYAETNGLTFTPDFVEA